MNCIDAIEGSVKCMIDGFFTIFTDGRLDDTEYIRNIKTLIQGTSVFVEANPEIVTGTQIVQQVLYDYAKKIWLSNLAQTQKQCNADDIDYYEYYYDYIYKHGVYPS